MTDFTMHRNAPEAFAFAHDLLQATKGHADRVVNIAAAFSVESFLHLILDNSDIIQSSGVRPACLLLS